MIKIYIKDLIFQIYRREMNKKDKCDVTIGILYDLINSFANSYDLFLIDGKYFAESKFSEIPFINVTNYDEYSYWLDEYKDEIEQLTKSIKILKKELIQQNWNYVDKNGVNIHKCIAAVMTLYKQRANQLNVAREHYKILTKALNK